LFNVGRDWLPFWIAIPPGLLIGILFFALRSNSSRTTWSRSLPWVYRCLPGVSQVIADQRCASLAEVLALLVKHDVPLHEGLRLATGASGDTRLESAAENMADAAERGQPLAQDSQAAMQFPPFLRWVLTSPTETGDLARMLQLAARTYRNRAERRTKWLRTAMPMMACAVLAGGVTLLYCFSVFGPLVQLIEELG
jgi:type II secretory pathway component PulF